MKIKQAVILAAGIGSRLRPLTNNKPKCMVEVNNISIIENALVNLKNIGVEKVTIIIGYLGEKIKQKITYKYLDMSIEYIYNEKFKATNSMYSLYLALKNISDSTLVIESDIMFEKNIVENDKNDDIIWYVDSNIKNIDGSYVQFDKGNTVINHDIKRDLSLIVDNDAKSLGILALSEKGVNLMKKWLADGVKHNKENIYYDLILKEHISSKIIKVYDVKGKKWFEIDNINDLKKAKELFK